MQEGGSTTASPLRARVEFVECGCHDLRAYGAVHVHGMHGTTAGLVLSSSARKEEWIGYAARLGR